MIPTTPPIPKIVYTLTKVAIAAAFIGAVADVLLLYNPAGGYETGDYQFLRGISQTRLLLGHYLGIFFIPIAMLGLLHVYYCLKDGGQVLAGTICLLAVYLGFPGVVYHGSVGYVAWIANGFAGNGYLSTSSVPRDIRLYIDPLAAFLPLGFMVVSGLFIYMVWKRPTRYSRWMLWCNPVSFYVIVLLSYFLIPAVGCVLLPAGFNLSFMLFFICSLVAEKKQAV